MAEKIVVREAGLSDAEGIACVHVETWRSAYAGLIPDAYLTDLTVARQARQWRRWIRGSSASEAVLVLERAGQDDGEVVGFGHAGPSRGPRSLGRGEVYTLYLADDWQGHGLGRLLLTGLFERLHRAGHDSAVIWVLSGNPSRFFYEALGGKRVAERREAFAGAILEESAYGWPDLEGWLSSSSSTAGD